MAIDTGRREFMSVLVGAAVGYPLAAHAQQPAMPVIGILDTSANTEDKLITFYAGLKLGGFVRDQNIDVEYYVAQDDYTRLPGLAAELVKRKVAMIVAIGAPAALAAKAATATIPIVFAVESDPVQAGLVASLNRPGGNVTGVTDMAVELTQKRLELLHELIPAATTFAFLVNPANPDAETQTKEALAAAHKMGLQVNILRARAESDFGMMFATLADLRSGGLAIGNDELFVSRSKALAAAALRRGVPAVFQYPEFIAAGGLMSYGRRLTEFYHQAGAYSVFILKGVKPSDLPVFQSRNDEFIINLKTASLLRLTVPASLSARADKMIE